jgi:hypothetical protein
MNYLFMKHSPIYLRLEQKYKAMKKLAREREMQIEILNRQFFELAERYSLERSNNSEKRSYAYTARTPEFCEAFNEVLSYEDKSSSDNPRTPTFVPNSGVLANPALSRAEETNENVLEVLPLSDCTYGEKAHSLELKREPLSCDNKPSSVCLDGVLSHNIDIPDMLVIPQTEIIVEEVQFKQEVEIVEASEKKVDVVEIEEEEVEVEEEQIEEEVEVEEEQIEEEEEEEIEEADATEEEEEAVYEMVIHGTRYYITNDINGEIYAILDDDDIGDIVGKYVEGKPIFG